MEGTVLALINAIHSNLGAKKKGTDIGSYIAASKKHALLLLFEGGLEKQPQLCGVSLSK